MPIRLFAKRAHCSELAECFSTKFDTDISKGRVLPKPLVRYQKSLPGDWTESRNLIWLISLDHRRGRSVSLYISPRGWSTAAILMSRATRTDYHMKFAATSELMPEKQENASL